MGDLSESQTIERVDERAFRLCTYAMEDGEGKGESSATAVERLIHDSFTAAVDYMSPLAPGLVGVVSLTAQVEETPPYAASLHNEWGGVKQRWNHQ